MLMSDRDLGADLGTCIRRAIESREPGSEARRSWHTREPALTLSADERTVAQAPASENGLTDPLSPTGKWPAFSAAASPDYAPGDETLAMPRSIGWPQALLRTSGWLVRTTRSLRLQRSPEFLLCFALSACRSHPL